MTKVPVIESERLVLRGLRLEDADAIATKIMDWDVIKMLARPPFPYSRDDAHRYLAKAVDYPWEFAITQRGGSDLLGVVGVTGHLGYWLGKDHWGQGYMTEATVALVDSYFSTTTSGKIISGVFTDNPGSQGVLRKLGFVEVGRSKMFCNSRAAGVDHIDVVLSRADWRRTAA
ncbi:MAG: GNAT family N-acetyltransferase [Pseudomonadota bacterium]